VPVSLRLRCDGGGAPHVAAGLCRGGPDPPGVPGPRSPYVFVLACVEICRYRVLPGWECVCKRFTLAPPPTLRGGRSAGGAGARRRSGHCSPAALPHRSSRPCRTARRNIESNWPPRRWVAMTPRRRVRDGFVRPGNGDLPTFPCVLTRRVPPRNVLSTCPRVAQLPDWQLSVSSEGRPSHR
jgi:hypothetical protein